MRTSDFEYTLPKKLIAAEPVTQRDASRLMVLHRDSMSVEHHLFHDLPKLLRPGDCLVLNDSRVLPARLYGRREKGGKAELLLLAPEPDGRWRALVKPGRKLSVGAVVRVGDADDEEGVVIHIEEVLSEGERLIRIETNQPIEEFLERYGKIPLPPYIVAARKTKTRRRPADHDADTVDDPPDEDDEERELRERADRERYQTVYAKPAGSVAAPTAGLHFTEDLLTVIRAGGIEVRRVTLHVGPGTFATVKTDDPREHPMHSERFSIAPSEAEAIQAAIDDPNRRVIAVGTTVVRVLESCMQSHGRIPSGSSSTNLLILPGFSFRAIDALVTNFHLPRSTLLMLVSAFAGRERILAAYDEAIRERYRFYSYGDAMVIL